MNASMQQDLATRRRAKGIAGVLLVIVLTGMIALGTPAGPEIDGVPAAIAPAPLPPAPASAQAAYPAAMYSPEGMPWQWDPEQ